MLAFLRRTETRLLSIVLIAQAIALYGVSREESTPAVAPLSSFPAQIQDWRMVQETPIEEEVQNVLKADDLLNRVYVSPESRTVSLFIAYFRSQRTGKAPHSPKNCLPGNGWTPLVSDEIKIQSPQGPAPVNRYVVQKGESKAVVLYWYQSHRRIIASEYLAKIHLVADSMRFNRSDTAIVRVVSNNVGDGSSEVAQKFSELLLPVLERQIP